MSVQGASIYETSAVRIERVTLPAGTRIYGHAHAVPQLVLLEKGHATVGAGGVTREIGSGVVRSSPAGDTVDLTFDAPSSCLIVLLEDRPCSVVPSVPAERAFVRSTRIESIRAAFERLLSDPQASPLELESLVLELCAEVTERHERPRSAATPPWLLRIRDRLRDAPQSIPCTTSLARESGHHPVYVARAFRRSFGIGLGEYARLARAESARLALMTTRLPICEVALHAGYADQSHLTRDLRRFLGTTPAAVRRRRDAVVSCVQETDLVIG